MRHTLPELASVKPGGLGMALAFLGLDGGGELRSITHCGGGCASVEVVGAICRSRLDGITIQKMSTVTLLDLYEVSKVRLYAKIIRLALSLCGYNLGHRGSWTVGVEGV